MGGNNKQNTSRKNARLKEIYEPNFTGKKRERYDALIKLKNQLEKQVRDLSEQSLVDSHEAGEDLADVGSDNFSRDTELQIMSEEEHTLLLVEEAIERLAEDVYGVCVDCNETIPEGRLDAIPYAKLCVNCKEARENNEGFTEGTEEEEELVE